MSDTLARALCDDIEFNELTQWLTINDITVMMFIINYDIIIFNSFNNLHFFPFLLVSYDFVIFVSKFYGLETSFKSIVKFYVILNGRKI